MQASNTGKKPFKPGWLESQGSKEIWSHPLCFCWCQRGCSLTAWYQEGAFAVFKLHREVGSTGSPGSSCSSFPTLPGRRHARTGLLLGQSRPGLLFCPKSKRLDLYGPVETQGTSCLHTKATSVFLWSDACGFAGGKIRRVIMCLLWGKVKSPEPALPSTHLVYLHLILSGVKNNGEALGIQSCAQGLRRESERKWESF